MQENSIRQCQSKDCKNPTMNDKSDLCQEHFSQFVDGNFRRMLHYNTCRIRQRQKAIQSLEIIEDKYVKCQACKELKPITKKDDSTQCTGPNSRRIATLKAMIRQIEKYNISLRGYPNHVAKKEREELAQLIKEEEQEKADMVRRLPLYSSKISGYRFLCGNCYDKAELADREKKKA